MRSRRVLTRVDWLALLLGGVLSVFALLGVERVPFHPDESTQLFMSADFETWLTHPLTLAWEPRTENDLRTHYRLVDMPLTRYLLGMARIISRMPPLPADWDWSKTWAENEAAGALPDSNLLYAGRLLLTLLIPLDLLLIYLIGKRLQGEITGLLALVLFGLNALVLVHNRRAMAEAGLTFGVLLGLWSLMRFSQRAWIAGITLALAVNAKQTAAALLPLALFALAQSTWQVKKMPGFLRLRRITERWLVFGLVFVLVTFAFNPVLWRYPIQAALAGWSQRQQLMQNQLADYNRLYPTRSTDSTLTRLAALIANLYLAPPAFAETSNYQSQTAPAEAAYLDQPGHNFFRGIAPGGMMLLLTLSGMILAILDLRRVPDSKSRVIILVLLATIFLALGIFWFIPIPWQRYVLPLVPLVCLWVAYLPGRLIEVEFGKVLKERPILDGEFE